MTSATRSRVARAAEGILRKPPQEMTRRSPAKLRCVHRWIEEQAGRRPEAVAVVSSGESLTYAELNARANRLARRLRAMGVGPEVLVGLCAGRSARTVVGLLAILKAGGAYVPLDPAYPAERIAFMLQDAQVSVLLTEERLRDQLPGGEARILCLDSESQTSDQESATNLDGGAGAGNLAYVIYTSGSTGKPKGVQITHGALANLLQSMRRLLSINERDALLAVTTLSFDIAALEIFSALDRWCPGGADRAGSGRRRGASGRSLERPWDHVSTGHAGHVAVAAGSGLAGSTDAYDALWRRGTSPRVSGSASGQGGRIVERLRSDRDDDLVVGLAG